MKIRTFYPFTLILLCIIGFIKPASAQTINVTTITPVVSICPGTSVTVTYAISGTGTFAAGNVFTAQLSNAAGSYTSPVNIGSVSRTTSGTINATIPSTTAEATYHIRVVASTNPSSQTNASSLVGIEVKRPDAPKTPTPPTYCEGVESIALDANPSVGGTLKWYGLDSSGPSSTTATKPNTNLIGSTPYYVSQTVNNCESPKATIIVIVNEKPGAPIVSPISYCLGQTADPLTATPSTGGSLNWYGTNSTGGTATSVAPVPSTTATGSNTYYVSQTSSKGCLGPRTGLIVTVNSVPAAPAGTTPPPYCEGVSASPLTATGSNLKWYGTNQIGGTSSSIAPTPSTANSSTYYVSQTVNGCESSRTGITVTIKAKPGNPATTPPAPYCQNQTAAALVASASPGGTLSWYGTNQIGGVASSSANTPSTSSAGTVNYYVSQTVDGCEGGRIGISVTVKPLPAAPGVSSPLLACQNRTGYTLSATPSSGGSLNWYTVPSGGTSTATAPPISTGATGSTVFYVSQSVNSCEGPRATLAVTVNTVPAPPSATPPNAYCEGVGAVPLSAAGQNLRWYGTNQSGGTASSNATTPNTDASAIGTKTYYVTQTVAACESDRAGIPVEVKDTPNAPGTSGIEFCQGTQAPTLTASLVSSATANWYGTNQSGGTASGNAPTPSNASVGITVYYVSQTLNSCEGPRASLNVRVKSTPGAPGVSSVSYCNNSQAQQLSAGGTNLKWYDVSDNFLNGTPTPPTNSVGDQIYKVSQTTNENCEGPKATLTVTIKPLPGQPTVKNVTYCQAQQDQPGQDVKPIEADGQNLRWYNTDGNSYPNAPTPSIDRGGTQEFKVSQTVNGCEGGRATLQVTIVSPPAPTAKQLVTYCINDTAVPLEATGESGSKLKWVDPYGRVFDVAVPFTFTPSTDPTGDAFYVYQIASYGCYSARTTVKVLVNGPPTLALAAPTTSVNLGQRAPLKLTFTSSGPFNYTLTGGYTGTSKTKDTTISVLPRGNTIYQIVGVSNSCGAGLPGNPATAQITVRVPTISTSNLNTTTICSGTSLTVPFTTTGQFNTGNAFRIQLVSVADTSKKYVTQATTTGSPISATLPAAIPSGQYFVRVNADNPEIAIIGSNSSSQLTVRSVASATLTGSQNIYEGSPANLTLTFGGDAPWTVVYADSLRSYSAITSTSPYVVEARPVRTTAYRLTRVSNSCGNGPISGTATITVLPLLGVEDNSLDPLVKTYPVPTETTLMIELDLPLTRDPATLSLIDTRGRPVLQQTTRNQRNELDLTTQPNGVYLLRIQVGDRQTVRKILKR